jgi:hypothetical protein
MRVIFCSLSFLEAQTSAKVLRQDSLSGQIEIAFLSPSARALNPVECQGAWPKRHALANNCPKNLKELQSTARNKRKSALKWPGIAAACLASKQRVGKSTMPVVTKISLYREIRVEGRKIGTAPVRPDLVENAFKFPTHKRFLQVAIEPAFVGVYGWRIFAFTGQHDHGHKKGTGIVAHALYEFQTVHDGHLEVEQHHLGLIVSESVLVDFFTEQIV